MARYQATPPRSSDVGDAVATESKNAPRRDAVPEALATAPSRRSGTRGEDDEQKPAAEGADGDGDGGADGHDAGRGP